jgi:AhpD family alkylhydroperoxidase
MSDLLLNIGDTRKAHRSKRVSRAFAERIMMAVTEVNGCRYCSYFHARLALKAGINKDEIGKTLAGNFQDAPKDELPALYFAQHYAESGGKPHAEAVDCMHEMYGLEMTRDIISYIRAIMVGNAWGNMFDELRLRIKGLVGRDTTLLEILGVVLGIFWMVPALLIQSIFSKI